jgi:hypothetical protein
LEGSFSLFDDGERVVDEADIFLDFFDEADILFDFSSSDDDDDDDESMSITGALSVAPFLFPLFKLVVRTTGVSVETQITDE